MGQNFIFKFIIDCFVDPFVGIEVVQLIVAMVIKRITKRLHKLFGDCSDRNPPKPHDQCKIQNNLTKQEIKISSKLNLINFV